LIDYTYAPDQKQAWKRANRLIKEWSVTYLDLSAWLEVTIAGALAVVISASSALYCQPAFCQASVLYLPHPKYTNSQTAKLMQFEPNMPVITRSEPTW